MVALMFATATASASEPKLSVSSNAETKSFVYEMDASSGETLIKLIDAENHVIYYENISAGSFTKRFDLRNLADGLYSFTSENALTTVFYTISVKADVLNILERKENAKPVFKVAERMLYINLLNLSKKPVTIEVYNSSDRLVFSEKRINEIRIEKALNFKKAYKDSYRVIVKDSNDTYYRDFNVN